MARRNGGRCRATPSLFGSMGSFATQERTLVPAVPLSMTSRASSSFRRLANLLTSLPVPRRVVSSAGGSRRRSCCSGVPSAPYCDSLSHSAFSCILSLSLSFSLSLSLSLSFTASNVSCRRRTDAARSRRPFQPRRRRQAPPAPLPLRSLRARRPPRIREERECRRSFREGGCRSRSGRDRRWRRLG